MATVVSICNRALLGIGARAQIAALNEGSTESNACNTLYAPTFESMARSARWNCLRAQITLTLLAAAQGTPENPDGTTLPLPPTPWLYQYSYPSTCLAMRFIVPSFPINSGSSVPFTTVNNNAATWVSGATQIPFAVAYATDAGGNPLQVILTNQSQAQAVYTVNQPNPAIWDSLFQQAMVSALGAFLVPALSLNMQLIQLMARQAEQIIIQARVADGNEGVVSVNRQADWIVARTSGGYLGVDNPWTQVPYDNISWPAY